MNMRFVGTGGVEVVTRSDFPVSNFILTEVAPVFDGYTVAMQIEVVANVCDTWPETLGFMFVSDSGRIALEAPAEVKAQTVVYADGAIGSIHPTAVWAPGVTFYQSEQAACFELARRGGCLT